MKLFSFDFCQKKRPPKKKRKVRIPKSTPFYENRLRTRHKNRTDEWTQTHFFCLGVGTGQPYPQPHSETIYETYESMVDSGGGLQMQFNPIDHVKWDATDFNRPAFMYTSAGDVAADGAPLMEFLDYVHAHVPSPSPQQINELSQRAEEFFKRTVPPDVLFYNFVIEAIQMYKSILELAKKGIVKTWEMERRKKQLYEEFIRKGKSPEDAWLAVFFALLPNMSDIRKIACSIDQANKKLAFLVKHNHKEVKRQFNVKQAYELTLDDTPVSMESIGSYYINQWDPDHPPHVAGNPSPPKEDSPDKWMLEYENYKLRFHAEALIVFHIPEYKLHDGGMGLVLQSILGLDRPFAAFWEAIPFSFVVDWVTPKIKELSGWLDDSLFMTFPEATILRVDHSFKLEVDVRLNVKHYPMGEEPFIEECGTAKYTRYMRAHGLPEGKPSVFASPHNVVIRSTLGVALVTQAIKRRWRRLLRRR